MDDLVECYLGYKIIVFEEIVGKGKNQLIFDKIVLDVVFEYVVEDVDVMMKLY